MGRPLPSRFFGNRNTGSASVTTDDGLSGEGVASIAVTGTFSGKTTATPFAVTISAPDLPNGVQAVATITFATGSTGTVTVSEQGSGYTSVPTATCALGGGSGTVTLTATLTVPDGIVTDASGYNFATIKVTAQTTAGGSALAGDIVAQKGSRRYRVATTDGTAVCSLVAGSPAVNQMSLIATDYSGNTYYVTKLTRHRVLLTQLTGSTHEFATSTSAAWTLGSLVAGDTGVTVQLANN
jgi:hypothetical protein